MKVTKANTFLDINLQIISSNRCGDVLHSKQFAEFALKYTGLRSKELRSHIFSGHKGAKGDANNERHFRVFINAWGRNKGLSMNSRL